MAIYVLTAPTLISALMPSGAGTLASGDTIELAGNDLIIDADAVDYPVTLTNTGTTAHLELRDGGRIMLNATLPTSICPWVDPESPLPESNYTAGLTGNASAEIQLNGTFSLGGGPASLPTATRPGNFYARVAEVFSNTSFRLDRDIPFHVGDQAYCITRSDYLHLKTVVDWDPQSLTLTVDSGLLYLSANSLVSLCAGGVCVNRLVQNNVYPVLNNSVSAGTLQLCCQGSNFSGSNSTFDVDRLLMGAKGQRFMSFNTFATGRARQCVLSTALPQHSLFPVEFGDVCAFSLLGGYSNNVSIYPTIKIGRGLFWELNCPSIASSDLCNLTVLNTLESPRVGSVRLRNSLIAGTYVADTAFLADGTVSRVARTDFPVDTDLPDAFYHAPATAADTPWRYEDYWVRKGETLRVACRAMRGGDDAAARVAIGAMSVWVPADGMPTLAEWRCEGGEPLQWQGGSVAWTNDTGEDCQVRVWTMATGLSGAYLRTWRATGGAL